MKNVLRWIFMSKKVSFFYSVLVVFTSVFGGPNAKAQPWAWAKGAGGASQELSRAIATDALGNTYVAGEWVGTPPIFDGMTFPFYSPEYKMFIVKYDPYGNVLWARCSGGSGSCGAESIAADDAGNVYVAGSYHASGIMFDSVTLGNPSSGDGYVVKYDATGNVRWAKQIGGVNCWATSVAADGFGNAIVVGKFDFVLFADGITPVVGAGQNDIFFVKYDPAGNVIWAKAAGGPRHDVPACVKADGFGNIYMTGVYTDTAAFGPVLLTNNAWFDMFVAKYDSAGNCIWAKGAGGASFDFGQSLAVDYAGNVIVSGRYASPSITIGSDVFANAGSSGYDLFVAKYDNDGNFAKCA